MYRYDEFDRRLVRERVAQFRDQTARFLAGRMSEDEFRPLRLRNGLYLQRHAPMLRVAIPYGLLCAAQLRALARIATRYDRGVAHFSTRQNVQFNWPRLADVPDILAALADVDMHAMQTSGNCVRNITCDHLTGVAPDEIVDARAWCEVVRQWSALNPEFSHLPRKFKIAVSGSPADRAVTAIHDLGLMAVRDADGEVGFRVLVGGGLGRTPMLAQVVREFLPWRHLLTYLEALLRVYNRFGRRDQRWKARIKFLVHDLGAAAFARQIECEWRQLIDGPSTLTPEEIRRIEARFEAPRRAPPTACDAPPVLRHAADPAFARWQARNVHPHRRAGAAAVTLTLKRPAAPPGDVSAEQMEAIADLAERYSYGEIRVTHEQNLLLPEVSASALPALWREAKAIGVASPTAGLLTDLIVCPGRDYCALASAHSLPVAAAIQRRFEDLDTQFDIGAIDINISGCVNSCGHHHVGHIGILGLEKGGAEHYQISLGGDQGAGASFGQVIGPAVPAAQVPELVARLIACYLAHRAGARERFIETFRRIGAGPFKEYAYGKRHRDARRGLRSLATA